MNVAVTTGDYNVAKKKGALLSTTLREYSPRYFKDLHYIKVWIGCNRLLA